MCNEKENKNHNIVLNDVICLPVENGDCGCYETPCSDDVCILNEWVCDGLPDCSDGGDEDDCGTSSDMCHADDTCPKAPYPMFKRIL